MMKPTKITFLILLSATIAAAAAAQDAGQRTLKMRIAVAPLDWSERYWVDDWQIPAAYRNAIHEKLIQKLHDTGRFIVLERQAMDALLKEQAIAEENTGESRRGRVVPAQSLVRGKVTDFSLRSSGAGGGVSIGGIGRVGANVTEAKMGINVRIFDVDTSEVLATEDATGSVQSTSFRIGANIGSAFATFQAFESSPLGEATTKAIDQAVEKIILRLGNRPWSASVADWDEDAREVMINAGSEVGVRAGDTFEIHRITRVIRDPETGQVLGRRTSRVGLIRVTEVEAKFSVAVPVEGSAFEIGDVVREVRPGG